MAKILVIDDDITTQLILQNALEEQGHEVTVAEDGEAGLLLTHQLMPDLIVCDWMMPKLDGLALCQKLKADPNLATIFFILVTARELVDDRVKGLDAGADDFLAKPIELQELLARVRAGLRLQSLTQALKHSNHHLNQAMQQLRQTQARLVQTEKMSGLRQMVAGIAHEFNNPITFIYSNLLFAQSYTQEILELLHLYQQEQSKPSPKVAEKLAEIDLDFLMVDLPKLFDSMKTGAERIRQTVQSLRNFSRLDEAELKLVNLHEGIDSALLTLQHRLQHNAYTQIEILKDYGKLPLVECYARELNQVFLHILNNAIDAIEQNSPPRSGQIIVTTKVCGNRVVIQIGDNGIGIPEQIRTQIFDPFFTTKSVGKGTGLGLSISYQIVVQQHGGLLKCYSQLGEGTKFWIEVPIRIATQAMSVTVA